MTTFTVDTVLKGPAMRSFTATGEHAGCGYRFELGETYLIYADKSKTNGALCVDKCMRVRRLSAAKTDLQYIDGLHAGRPQGLLTGMVLRKGRDRTLHGLRGTMDVVATGAGASYSVRTEPGGHFTLVLPPGEFEVRLTHQDKTILPPQRLVVTNGATVKQSFVIESHSRLSGDGVCGRVLGYCGRRNRAAAAQPIQSRMGTA